MNKTLTVLAISLCLSASAFAGEFTMKLAMKQLHTDFTKLNHAILVSDLDAVAAAAHAIAHHDPPAMSQRMKIKAMLGDEMSGFKAADSKVHDLAVKIETAAKQGDASELLTLQSAMLGACMACHTTYRVRVMDMLN